MNNNINHEVKEYIIDAFGCKSDLSNPIVAKKSISVIKRAAESAGAKIIDVHFTTYTVHGFTTVALLAESHIILTTWPEINYASINIYLCNSSMSYNVAIETILSYLSPSSYHSSWFRHLCLSKNTRRIYLASSGVDLLNAHHISKHVFNQIITVTSFIKQHGYSVISAYEKQDFNQHPNSDETYNKLDINEINHCDIVVAIITNNSPDVYVELGWASAMKKPIIIYKSDDKQLASLIDLVERLGKVTDLRIVKSLRALLSAVSELTHLKRKSNVK